MSFDTKTLCYEKRFLYQHIKSLIPIRNVSQPGSKDEAFAIVWTVDYSADVISCNWGPEDGALWNTRINCMVAGILFLL